MGIDRLEGPSGGPAAVGLALNDLMPSRPLANTMLRAASQPQITQPLQLFTLQLDDIVDEKFPQRATLTGWRYLIVDNGPLAAADVETAGDSFQRLMHGQYVDRLMEAVQFAENRFANVADSYEPRILEIPVLYVGTLWLMGQRNNDVYIPFADVSREGSDPAIDESFVKRILAKAELKRASLKNVASTPRGNTEGQASN